MRHKRYIVIATRPGGYLRLGWETEWEQLSCARRYFNQGWEIKLETLEE